MLPYFKYTEDIQNFCHLMGFIIDLPNLHFEYVCMNSLEYSPIPRITSYNFGPNNDSLIPPEKVIHYLTLILNGYSFKKAVNELNVVG